MYIYMYTPRLYVYTYTKYILRQAVGGNGGVYKRRGKDW